MNLLEVGQFVSILLAAAGTPGMTYLVMARLHKQQIVNMAESCKACRKSLDDKIENLDEVVGVLDVRQKDLREKDLPDNYVKRRDIEALEKKCDREVEIVHKRIEKYHPGTGRG